MSILSTIDTMAFRFLKSGFRAFCICMVLWVFAPDSTYARIETNIRRDTMITSQPDSFKAEGNVGITGLYQTGDENRFVVSMISVITFGKKVCQAEPLTSISYSVRPGKQVEGEYLENIIVRFISNKIVYPAIAPAVDRSYLRKIDYRVAISAAAVVNIYNKHDQVIRFALGYNHEYAQYATGAFKPEIIPGDDHYARQSDQAYARLKGINRFWRRRIILSYDFMFQPSFREIRDYRWVLIANLDVPIYKGIDFRISSVNSYETFTATAASKSNTRLTFGASINF